MQSFKTLTDAIALAEFAHRNQVDKAGLPYIDHPKRVLAKVQAQGALPYVQIAAILHDVTEDTRFTPQMLLGLGFSEAAVNIVRLLDRNESAAQFLVDPRRLSNRAFLGIDDPDDYYYIAILQNYGATMVKLADIEDNLSPWRLSYLSADTQARLQAKYAHAKELLNG